MFRTTGAQKASHVCFDGLVGRTQVVDVCVTSPDVLMKEGVGKS